MRTVQTRSRHLRQEQNGWPAIIQVGGMPLAGLTAGPNGSAVCPLTVAVLAAIVAIVAIVAIWSGKDFVFSLRGWFRGGATSPPPPLQQPPQGARKKKPLRSRVSSRIPRKSG